MNVKKKVHSRIRGWFPKEPWLGGNHVKLGCESKQPPLVIPSGYTTRAAQSALALTVVWVMLDAFLGFFAVEIARDSGFFPLSVVLWIISGIAIGGFSGVTLVRKMVKRLSKNYEYHPSIADILQFSLPVILFYLAGIILVWLFQPTLFLDASLELMVSTYAFGTAFALAETMLFSAYEKRGNMQLMQKTFGGGIIAIPNPPRPFWNGKAVDTEASQTKESS